MRREERRRGQLKDQIVAVFEERSMPLIDVLYKTRVGIMKTIKAMVKGTRQRQRQRCFAADRSVSKAKMER
jgi:hypothetical protein